MVFIDTPLDVAMARRMLRTFALAQRGNVEHVIESLIAELTAYLEYARHAYCELEKQVKTKCDLVLDGRTSIDDLARQLVDVAKHLSFARRPC